MSRALRLFFTLNLFVIGIILAACNQSSPSPAPSPPDAAAHIEKIPAADPGKFNKVTARLWKNPYLIVKAHGVVLFDAVNNEEKLLKPDEVPDALAHLPQSAWPYGRVVAVTVSDVTSSQDDKANLLKNKGLVSGTLLGMHIYVNWVPAS